ncbi:MULTISPECIES: hypothetical protein [unclassified Sphingomonas]|nr:MULTISPECIES: hypothetical protein [unclassified Sphingomonas]
MAVDIMVMQLDRVRGHAKTEEVQEGGKVSLPPLNATTKRR